MSSESHCWFSQVPPFAIVANGYVVDEAVLRDEAAADQREVEVAVVEAVQAERERADERDQGADQRPGRSRGEASS